MEWSVFELRQYTLHPGGREALVELFDREFTAGLEAVGMRVVGQFADLGDPDRFVWIRAFRDLGDRVRALRAFYEEGEVWRTNRDRANATMVDSDDVLLLRPVPGLPAPGGSGGSGSGPVTAVVCPVGGPGFGEFFGDVAAPALAAAGARLLGCLETEPAPNGYPRLPVREGEDVFVWLARSVDDATCAAVLADLAGRMAGAPQVLRLAPTGKSRITP